MVEALLEREISKLKKEAQEKDDRIKALELAASDVQSAITGPSHALASIPLNELEAGLPKLRNALQCAICTELFTEPHTVDCGHTFCYQCLKQWLEIRKQCPTCRKPLTRHPMLSFTVQHQDLFGAFHLQIGR
ncbi:hypothetical protein BC943DRAFT_99484 [Umbelopsis sp. AD052]|nr:hypothetical protein BC943DRAFT_99484 [Umbelopsis sp. AD052]